MYKSLIALMGIMLLGCTAPPAHVERNVGDQFQEGKTTCDEVRSVMGKPTSETDIDKDKTVLCYGNHETEINPAAMIPLVGLFFTGAKSESRILCFTFENNVLTDKKYTSHTARAGLNAPE